MSLSLRWLLAGLMVGALALSACEDGTCSGDNCVCEDGEDCSFDCADGKCSQECSSGSVCEASCEGGGCSQSCSSGAECTFSCAGGGCTQSCSASNQCTASCSGAGCTSDTNLPF